MLQVIADTLQNITVAGYNGNVNLSESVQKLLSVLGNETLSGTQIMNRLGLSHRPTFRKNYLNPALNIKIIEMTIPDKPNSRNQKYRRK